MNNLQDLKTLLRDFFVENFIFLVNDEDIMVKYSRRERYEAVFNSWMRYLTENPTSFTDETLKVHLKRLQHHLAGYIKTGDHDASVYSDARQASINKFKNMTKQEWDDVFALCRE